MGTTLTNGIYLPSEGEKNCYQGLASNWNKVDGALGDVAELKRLIENKFTKEIVTELPTEDINPYCIYMILKTDPETNNIYDEWVYINNAWEYLGNTQVDMTQYYTKQEVNELPAVASGVTSTKVGNYDTHIADTNIHVTANDKTKWTNSANTHVLRLALSALTPSTSDNSFSNLDDSTALKVGDKVMDTAGVLFEVTAIDTANSTFTIGTSLIDLAQDSDVVHKSGDETIGGVKTFSDNTLVGNGNTNITISSNRQITANGFASTIGNHSYSYMQLQAKVNYADSSSPINVTVGLDINEDAYADGKKSSLSPSGNNVVNLGKSGKRWANVYATNYYYGSSETEFSTKFVTTDTAQTIVGKEFISDLFFTSTGVLDVSGGRIASIYRDTNKKEVARITGGVQSSGRSLLEMTVRDIFNNEYQTCGFGLRFQSSSVYGLIPITGDTHIVGSNNAKLKSLYTNKINDLEPSSLSLPSGRNTRVDISSYFTNLGSGDTNSYSVSANGYIYMQLKDIATVHCFDFESLSTTVADYIQTFSRGNDGQLYVLFPVKKDHVFKSTWYTNTTVTISGAYFIPCLGNV